MPFALTLVGLLLVITGFQDTYKQFGTLVRGDFSGSGGGNFLFWGASVAVVGGLGYIKSLESFSRVFMGLILFILIIAIYKKNPNVFSNISAGISQGGTAPVNPIGTPIAGSSNTGTNNNSFNLSNVAQAGSIITTIDSFF